MDALARVTSQRGEQMTTYIYMTMLLLCLHVTHVTKVLLKMVVDWISWRAVVGERQWKGRGPESGVCCYDAVKKHLCFPFYPQ
jgi:hypothetical protein